MVAISINSIVLTIFAATSILAATNNQDINSTAIQQPSKNHNNKHHGNGHHGGKHKGKGKGHGKKTPPKNSSSFNGKLAAYVTDWVHNIIDFKKESKKKRIINISNYTYSFFFSLSHFQIILLGQN